VKEADAEVTEERGAEDADAAVKGDGRAVKALPTDAEEHAQTDEGAEDAREREEERDAADAREREAETESDEAVTEACGVAETRKREAEEAAAALRVELEEERRRCCALQEQVGAKKRTRGQKYQQKKILGTPLCTSYYSMYMSSYYYISVRSISACWTSVLCRGSPYICQNNKISYYYITSVCRTPLYISYYSMYVSAED
jgi:hypothetical protein